VLIRIKTIFMGSMKKNKVARNENYENCFLRNKKNGKNFKEKE
jgi:hypothetical protein